MKWPVRVGWKHALWRLLFHKASYMMEVFNFIGRSSGEIRTPSVLSDASESVQHSIRPRMSNTEDFRHLNWICFALWKQAKEVTAFTISVCMPNSPHLWHWTWCLLGRRCWHSSATSPYSIHDSVSGHLPLQALFCSSHLQEGIVYTVDYTVKCFLLLRTSIWM